jgi:gas vesicle protein
MSENNDFGAFFAGLMIGGLVGAAAALLTAPKSGEETRTLIKDKSIELRDRAVEVSQDARNKAEEALEEARTRADEALVDLRVKAEDLAKMTKERAIELQQKAKAPLSEDGVPLVIKDALDAEDN